MNKGQKKIQTFLFIVGILLILITYFYYPYKNKSLVEKNIQEDLPSDSVDLNDKSTSFENLEYQGFYDIDKTFSVKSESAYILNEDSDIIYMDKMKETIYMNDGRIITITSDRGKYSKLDSNMWFVDNVRATDGKTDILSGNLDLLASEDTASIYNNVSIASPNGTLKSDKIDYNFETKYYKATMMTSEEKVKVKIVR